MAAPPDAGWSSGWWRSAGGNIGGGQPQGGWGQPQQPQGGNQFSGGAQSRLQQLALQRRLTKADWTPMMTFRSDLSLKQ
ncbi:hypothetical protein ACNKHW_26170 [Shigella flexneri]